LKNQSWQPHTIFHKSLLSDIPSMKENSPPASILQFTDCQIRH